MQFTFNQVRKLIEGLPATKIPIYLANLETSE